MNYPAELKYNKDDLWIKVDGNTALIGITDFAQDQLGEVLFVELPDADDEFSKGEEFSVVESSKQASSLLAPFSFKVLESNEKLDDEPEYVNQDAYDAWIVKVEIVDEDGMEDLISADDYQATL